MTEYVITIEQIKDLVMQSAVEAVDGYKLGVVKQIWQYPSLPEIVRCRDCTYYDDEPDLESSMPKCWRDPEHRGAPIWTPPDGFCAWGERRKA